MSDIVWINAAVVRAIHDEQLAEHGGPGGLRDEGGLESALARPENLYAYGDPDIAALAAAYGFGLSRNHPFADGNKRTSFVIVELFLALNRYALLADDAEVVKVWLQLASGDLTEEALADWLRANIQAD